MSIRWKSPNQGLAASLARWALASCGAATVVFAFSTPSDATTEVARHDAEGNKLNAASDDANGTQGEGRSGELSRWMKRTSQEGSGSVLTAALEHVGPWARNQTPADNQAPAKVPPRGGEGAR